MEEFELPKDFKETPDGISIAELSRQLSNKEDEISHIHLWYGIKAIDKNLNEIKSDYVKKSEFKPVQKIVYGGVAMVLVAVFGGILNLVVTKSNAVEAIRNKNNAETTINK